MDVRSTVDGLRAVIVRVHCPTHLIHTRLDFIAEPHYWKGDIGIM